MIRYLSLAHLRLISLPFLSFGLSQCTQGPTEAECVTLLDRYTELVIAQSRLQTTDREKQQLKKEAREKAYHDPEFWRCSSAISRSDFECAMSAHNADEIERCLL